MDPDTRDLQPRILPLSIAARALLVGFSDAIEAAQKLSGTLAHITGYASKAAEQAARIAGVLTLWADLHAPEVTVTDMADAIELAQFYLSEAGRLADAAQVSAEIEKAEALRTWLLSGWAEPEVLVRDVVQEKHGWLVPLGSGAVVRGVPRKEAWHIVRGDGDVV